MNVLFEVILTEILPNDAATYRPLKKSEITTNYGVIFDPLALKLFSERLD